MADFSKFSDKELLGIYKKRQTVGGVFGRVPVGEYERGERNILGDIFERPGAATRGFIQNIGRTGQSPIAGYRQGALEPGKVPTFQDLALNKYWKGVPPERTNVAVPGGMVASAGGLAADIATNPANLLAMLAGKAPIGGGKTLGGVIGQTKPAQAISRYVTRPRFMGGSKAGQGLPTGKMFKRPWTKFKRHPVTDTQRVERAIAGKKEMAAISSKQAREATSRALQADREYTVRLLNQTDDTMKQNIEVMKVDLQKSAEKGSLQFQDKLQRFIRENSKGYRNGLDDVSNGLAKRGANVTKGEMNNLLTKTVQEATEAELPVGRAQNVIQKLMETKYGTTQFSKNFTFTEIMNDIQLVRGSLACGVKAGRAGFAPDEVIVAVLNKNWGNIVGKRIPEFAKLNKSYAPVIQAMKKSHKIFKPYAGKLETKTGTEFLKRVGTGKAEAGELRFLQRLEKGSEFAPGVGKISQPVQKVGKQIKLLEAKRPLAGRAIQEQALTRQAGLQRDLTAREAVITKNLQGWLSKLSELERKAVLNQWLRRGGMVAGGGMLLYMVKKQMAGSLLDSLSGGSGGEGQSQSQF